MKGLAIHIEGLCVSYDDVQVLGGINLNIEQGEFIALLGSSGCGKTTLLRALAGFVPVGSGSITVGQQAVTGLPPEKRNMAMMFQSYALWPHMSVARNIGYGLRLRKWAKARIQERVNELTELVGLQGLEGRNVQELSGGQRQRVALARALAIDPPILLLDEPLSNLDARIRLAMRHELRSLQQRLGLTTILVTHDREEAMALADRVVILEQGRVMQVGTPEELYSRPLTPFVAAFMGAENIFPVTAATHGGRVRLSGANILGDAATPDMVSLPLAGRYGVHAPQEPYGNMAARFRSEAAFLQADTTQQPDHLMLKGHVVQVSYLGSAYRHTVQAGEHVFLVDHPERLPEAAPVTICVPARALFLFSESTSESSRLVNKPAADDRTDRIGNAAGCICTTASEGASGIVPAGAGSRALGSARGAAAASAPVPSGTAL